MPEKDFRLYAKYAQTEVLPYRRSELYFAQLAYMMACCMGGYQGEVSDFILNKKRIESGSEEAQQVDGSFLEEW